MHTPRSAVCFFLLLALSVAVVAAQAQRDPALTEVWDPVPPKVDPGDASRAPSDAIVLFDGTDLSAWSGRDGAAEWKVEDGAFTIVPGAGGLATRTAFGDVQLHLEWRSPTVLTGEGQDRGNSGVFFMSLYEVQVLDSYGQEPALNGCGAVYSIAMPSENASLPPGQWQTYDIVFRAPRFDQAGAVVELPRVTVVHNGTLIHDDRELPGTTAGGLDREMRAAGPILLQFHGDPVRYRNIRVRSLDS